jgi:hypothetical protein
MHRGIVHTVKGNILYAFIGKMKISFGESSLICQFIICTDNFKIFQLLAISTRISQMASSIFHDEAGLPI